MRLDAIATTDYGRRRFQSCFRTLPDDADKQVAALAPSVLAINKQIYFEQVMVLYSNDFYMADPYTLHTFVINLGARAASYLKRVTLVNWGSYRSQQKSYNHSCFAALVSATNLERLTIRGNLYSVNPVGAARQIYRDGFPWLEAVGAAKGRVDAALDILEVSADNFLNWGERRTAHVDEERDKRNAELFKEELSKLLNAHVDRIRGYPQKKK